MKLLRGAWKLLVGIKDALVLVAMLLFFGGLFAALALRPNPAAIRDGALVIDFNGSIVEQPRAPQFAFAGGDGPPELRLRDVIRAIRAAQDDARVKALVLDLDNFAGGLPAALNEVGAAVEAVRKSGKPVLAYATGYSDASYRIAAHASEIWLHPMGGIVFTGPGGSQLYYKGLIEKLGVTVHVYRVGKYKSFIEPYIRSDQSPEAKENSTALYGAIVNDWREQVGRARPKAQSAQFLAQGTERILAAQGDIAAANRAAGLVDQLGDRTAFNDRVAQIAGAAPGKGGSFRRIRYKDFLAAHPLPSDGAAIGVLTVAGDIVDGKAEVGTAGGDSIARLLLDGLEKKNLKALVVRVDSPGGSALASEVIRSAIGRAKAKGLPVVVSMGGVAASGGYWVATAGDTIFAEPSTITGSIGIFGVVPSFEKSLAKLGIATDGVKTTPLSGQPDVAGGFTPQIDALFQAGIDHGYRQFLERVAKARGKTVAQVDEIAQGRVWDGGTARQIGLVDRFGGLEEAIAEAARRAKLDPAKVHAEYLEKKPDWWAELLSGLSRKTDEDEAGAPGDAYSRLAAERRALFARALGDARRLAGGAAIQARCLECAALAPARAEAADRQLMALLLDRVAR